MTDFIINGERKEIKEPWVVFTVYGEVHEPSGKPGGLIVRMPSGRVPWSKKIAPAINKLVKKYAERGVKNPYWNVDGEGTVFIGKNFYYGTQKPIPESVRLWDCKAFAHYEWNGKELIKVEE